MPDSNIPLVPSCQELELDDGRAWHDMAKAQRAFSEIHRVLLCKINTALECNIGDLQPP